MTVYKVYFIIFLIIILCNAKTCLDNPVVLDPLATTVVISVNPWPSSSINSNIAKILLEQAVGINTQLVQIDEYSQWPKLSSGEIHVCLENWPSSHTADELEYIQQDKTVMVAGPLGVIGQIGWFTGEFSLAMDPSVAVSRFYDHPSVTEIFNHTIYGSDPDWNIYDQTIIQQYNYSLNVVNLGEDQVIDLLNHTYNQGVPILFNFKSPHAIFAEYSLFRISLPQMAADSYYPPDILTKIVHMGFRDISPSGFFLTSTFTLQTYEQISMLFLLSQGMAVEDVACQWVRNNTLKWSNWIIPLPNLVSYIAWDSPLGIVVGILTSIVLLLCLTFSIILSIRKNHPNVRAGGFMLMQLILTGSVLMGIAPVMLLGYASVMSCSIAIFFFGFGFTVMWGCILLKEYRIHVIFKMAQKLKKKRKNYTDPHMIKLLLPMISLEVIIDILWLTITPSQTDYGYCKQNSSVILSVYLFYKLILLLIACIMAIQTRNMSTKFSESRSVMIGIYAFTVLTVLILIMTLFLTVTGIIFAVSIGINIAILSFVIPVFCTKIYLTFVVDEESTSTSHKSSKV